jgi:ABC-type branched-subunit amino acid transport system substrate-binding protein
MRRSECPFQADPSSGDGVEREGTDTVSGAARASRGRGGRFAALLSVTIAVAFASACGSSTSRTTRGAVPSVATARVPEVTPCRSGTAGPSSEIGVTPGTITVGVVADVTGARAAFRSNWEAMQAFAAYCNDQGGIAGRRLEVQLFDSSVFNHRRAITDACTSVFAVVGSAAAFDGDGATTETDCGIPDVPAVVAEPAHDRVPTVVQPLPAPQQLYLVGPLRYLAQVDHRAVRHSAIAYLNVGVTAIRTARQVAASTDVGYRFTVKSVIPALTGPADYARIAGQIAARHVGYVTVQGTITDLVGLQTALAGRDYRPAIVDAGPLFYDPKYPQLAGEAAEGTYVIAQTTPFDDAARVPEVARYVEWLQRTVPGAQPTAQGARSWSAGLLFAEAARRASSHLDRTTLLTRLRGIHAWDGNGIQIRTDPGAGRSSPCFAYVRVEGGTFRRAYPARGFACPRDGWLRLTRDFTHL